MSRPKLHVAAALLAVALVGVIAPSSAATLYECPEGFDLPMPVAVVVLEGTTVNSIVADDEDARSRQEDFIRDAVDSAEAILAKAGICLVLQGVWQEPVALEAITGGVNPDGSLVTVTADVDFVLDHDDTPTELDGRVELVGVSSQATELANSPPPPPISFEWHAPGRGYVIVFTDYLYPSSDVAGKSGDDYNTPVNFIAFPHRQVPVVAHERVGMYIAHEFAHLFGGTLDHHPDPDNLLSETGGTELEDDQIAAIREGARHRAIHSEHDVWHDERGDTSLGHVDLERGHVYAADEPVDLDIAVQLAGLFPDTTVSTSLEVLLDTDDDVSTGTAVGSHQGVDKILRLSLSGVFPFSGASSADVVDVRTGRRVELPPPNAQRSRLWHDDFGADPSIPESVDDHDVILQSVPLSALTPLAETVPVTVRMTDAGAGAEDTVAFELDLSAPIPDATPPTVTVGGVSDGQVLGHSGDLVLTYGAFDTGSGLEDVTATLDGEPLARGTTVPLWTLGLGDHELVVTASDTAGNTVSEAVRFSVATSVSDLAVLLDRFLGEDRLSAAEHRALKARLHAAERVADRRAIFERALTSFAGVAARQVDDAEAAAVLVRDAAALTGEGGR